MNRRENTIHCCGLLLLLSFIGWGCINTIPPAPKKCQTEKDCTHPDYLCDAQTGQCTKRTQAGCTSDKDCGYKRKCNPKSGIFGLCFDICTDDMNCSEGSFCDKKISRCICYERECVKQSDGNGTYSCHPVTQQCEPECLTNDDCEGKEMCLGSARKKHCMMHTQANDDECKLDADCERNARNKWCNVLSVPKRCSQHHVCQRDADCHLEPTKIFCDKKIHSCVECRLSSDCKNGEYCMKNGFCQRIAVP